MKSTPIRETDHLLTPQNSALILIAYQPSQVTTIASMDTIPQLASVLHGSDEIRAFLRFCLRVHSPFRCTQPDMQPLGESGE